MMQIFHVWLLVMLVLIAYFWSNDDIEGNGDK